MIAEIVLDSPAKEVGGIYDYKVPEELEAVAKVGQRVEVLFGISNRKCEGFIMTLKEKTDIRKLKNICKIIDEEPLIRDRELQIARFISDRYFCNIGAALGLMTPDIVKARTKKELIENPTDDFTPTEEQANVINQIRDKINSDTYNEILLHGVTGSGKTEVYIQTIKHALELGKGAIVLVPEISLTPQTVKRFVSRLGDKVAVIHSRLSKGERYTQWKRVKDGEARVVVGARSALFSPVENLGIVIIDEEHDSSYKSGQTPLYHAREVAEKICEIDKAVLVLGSATPDICTYYRAMKNEMIYLPMKKRTNSAPLPKVEIVDMKQELVNGNRTIFSKSLADEMNKNLALGQQSILFLNRRGFSTFVSCRNCGFVMKCRHCNVVLNYHIGDNKLKCHYCGYEEINPVVCPSCRSKYIKYFGIGTEKIESEVKNFFPTSTVLRMDVDTTTKKDSHEQILKEFREKNVDVLVGTQMIAKGHDFPNVTLVGVVAADTSLNNDDYRASERTFQLITQVAGRAGRGELEGRVVVQTYQNDNYAILAAKEHNYEKFYENEIKFREALTNPPFCDIICMNISGKDEKNVVDYSMELQKAIYSELSNVALVLPAMVCPISKINNKYRFRILIKCRLNNDIKNKLDAILKQERFISSKNIDVVTDVNPINLN